jgi:hypothetical protein
MRDWEEKDFFSNTFNKSPHTDTGMPLSNKRRKSRLLRHAGMREFILFEASLILPKDGRSPEPCTDLAPATRARSPGSQ